MNSSDALVPNILRGVVTAAVLAAGAILLRLDQQVAINTEKISRVLFHSDQRDEQIQMKLSQIERLLDEMKRK